MDKETALDPLNTTISSKKMPFTSAERELIVTLVRDRPVIEDKRTHAKNIELKRQAWEDLTVAYNSQPYVSPRLTHQLRRCWENMKTLRKKELLQKSRTANVTSLKRTDKKKLLSETDPRIKRTYINMQQDQELHELRIKREKILIERETNLLEYQKTLQNLEIQKAKLEIELLTKHIGKKK